MNETPVTVSCPGCDASIDARHPLRTYRSPVDEQRYLLYGCRRCDLEFWWPRRLSPDIYRSEILQQYEEYHQGRRPFPPWTRPFFDLIPLKSGRILDVGCGDGAFLARAAALGFDAQGIDLDEHSVRVAREKHGLHATATPLATFLQSAQAGGMHFDIVCFFEVLEHQADLGAFLDAIRTAVEAGGYIAGSVPNRKRFLARVDRRVGTGDLPPHHFLWFSARALTHILNRHGFHNVLVVPSGNIGIGSLLSKVTHLGTSLLGPLAHRWPRVSKSVTRILTAPIVILLWMGLKWRPAHLYFQARSTPHSDD